MLEQKDLDAIQGIVETVVDKRLTESENMILKEMDRGHEILEKRIEKVEKNLEELQQYYKINKLENENTTLLLKMITDLKAEVDELKKKIA